MQVQLLSRAHFGQQALIVKQRTFNPWNGEHYPGDPPFPSRLAVGRLALNQETVVRIHAREPFQHRPLA